MSDLGLHRFEQRKATILAIMDDLGDATLIDIGRDRRLRQIRVETRAPGHGLPTQARFVYVEWFQRVPRGWRLLRYQYDYLDPRHGGRFAYHWHSVRRRRDVHHAHCEERLGAPADEHYRSYEVDLLEAHEEFARVYAADQPVDCSGLRPLS